MLLANLGAEREQLITNLANHLLNTVSPAAAARLRAPGRAMANANGRTAAPVYAPQVRDHQPRDPLIAT